MRLSITLLEKHAGRLVATTCTLSHMPCAAEAYFGRLVGDAILSRRGLPSSTCKSARAPSSNMLMAVAEPARAPCLPTSADRTGRVV